MTVKTVAKIIGAGWILLAAACTVAILTGCSDSTAPVIPESPTIQDYVAALNTKVDSLYRQGKTVRYGVINLCDSCPPYLVLQQTSK